MYCGNALGKVANGLLRLLSDIVLFIFVRSVAVAGCVVDVAATEVLVTGFATGLTLLAGLTGMYCCKLISIVVAGIAAIGFAVNGTPLNKPGCAVNKPSVLGLFNGFPMLSKTNGPPPCNLPPYSFNNLLFSCIVSIAASLARTTSCIRISSSISAKKERLDKGFKSLSLYLSLIFLDACANVLPLYLVEMCFVFIPIVYR